MIDFQRYLAAKKSVDDRAINRPVWTKLVEEISNLEFRPPLRVLELGCGIGTMVERLIEWGFADQVEYLGFDTNRENIQAAGKRLEPWAQRHGFQVQSHKDGLEIRNGDLNWKVNFIEADFRTYRAPQSHFNILIANAFLDLVDIPEVISKVSALLSPNGLYYFTINFDGCTIIEPVSDEKRNSEIISLYHRSMDSRLVDGKLSGDSCTGRKLFSYLRSAGAEIFEAGASDWVVFPGADGYPDDEEYFLNCIIDFFEIELINQPALDQGMLHEWLEEKRLQINQGDLIYIAHQLDFVGSFPEAE